MTDLFTTAITVGTTRVRIATASEFNRVVKVNASETDVLTVAFTETESGFNVNPGRLISGSEIGDLSTSFALPAGKELWASTISGTIGASFMITVA